jgi:PRTRC genetic system protein A
VKPAGYLINGRWGPAGEAGLYYDYIFARNGVFIRARNHLLGATVCISPVEIRGLEPLEEVITLEHGKIPRRLYDLALSLFIASSDRERFLAVTWEGEYRLRMPWQDREKASVEYEAIPFSVMDIHSHGGMDAFFSTTDDSDEQGLRLYMVAGRVNTLVPEVKLRIGVYGYFAPLSLDEVFDV